MKIASGKELKTIFLLVTSAVCFLLFLKLSEEVWSKESIVIFDKQISDYIYTLRTPFLTSIIQFVTSLADANTVIVFAVVAIIVLYVVKRRKMLFVFLVAIPSNLFIVEVAKEIFVRPRPLQENALVLANSFSYPSGHTLMAVTIYGFVGIYIAETVKSKKISFFANVIVALLVISVGFSRIYLGVHWFSDVLGSFLIGVSWLCILNLIVMYHDQIRVRIGRFYGIK